MPPRSLSSAVALVGLGALAAVESGGCNKRPDSLGSVTRSALPLLQLANGSSGADPRSIFADYGLRPRPGLRYLCGHYELAPDGRLITQDLFAGSAEPTQLEREIAAERTRQRDENTPASKRNVKIVIKSQSKFSWPRSCPKEMAKQARSILVASRVL